MANSDNIIWPGWETVGLIGHGSFGAVYEIQKNIFGDVEKAALKVISIPQNAGDIDEMYSDGYDDESITATFQSHLKSIVSEYSLMRKMIGCANIVICDDVRYVQHEDGFGWDIFIKMELLTPLTKALPSHIPEDTVIKLGQDICKALAECREYDIIHRDIKPQNIFVSSRGDYKLGDFGIAKTVEKTMGGTKIGTYKYMAPEVFHNQPYGAAANICSLGLVLYWMLNERRMPFLPLPPLKLKAGMEDDARYRRFSGEPLPPPAHGSQELKQIVLKACAFDPKDRYQSAREMLEALENLGKNPLVEDPSDDDVTVFLPYGSRVHADAEGDGDQTVLAPRVSLNQQEEALRRKEAEEKERLRRELEEQERLRKEQEEQERLRKEQEEQEQLRREQEEARLRKEQERLEREQERIRREQEKLTQAKKELERLRREREEQDRRMKEEEENRRRAAEARKRREEIQRAQEEQLRLRKEQEEKEQVRNELARRKASEEAIRKQTEQELWKQNKEMESQQKESAKNKKLWISLVCIALVLLLLSPILSGCWSTAPSGEVYYYIWGVKATGFHEIDGDTYHFYSNGVMATGWVYFGGYWYYFDSYGRMATGRTAIDGRVYYFDSQTGALIGNR